MDKTPVILDTDPGVDDALAMMLALASPELDVLGVCTVSGNVPLDVGTRNALKVLGLLGRLDIPVFRGADRPLVRDPVFATEVHGADGMGQANLSMPDVDARDDAAGFLIETLMSRPGEVVIIAVGPLTNLALAERRAPGILKRALQIVVMGGAIAEPGNATPVAEFNFYADPHAAQEVVRSVANLLLVPLDATHQVGLTASVIEEQIRPADTECSNFVVQAVQNILQIGEKLGRDLAVYLHDPLAVGAVIAPDLMGIQTFCLDVEAAGDLTLGQAVADRRPVVLKGRPGAPTACVMDVDAGAFVRLFLERALGMHLAM